MKIWLKEFQDYTLAKLQADLLPHIKVERLTDLTATTSGDMIFCSKDDPATDFGMGLRKVFLEDCYDRLQKSFLKSFPFNYERYYLSSAIERAKEPDIDTIAVGSSYMQMGIEEQHAPNLVNLSLASQDIYYSKALAEKVIAANPRLKYLVYGFSYYAMLCDLSLTKSGSESIRVRRVYYPILQDAHHNIFMATMDEYAPPSPIFDVAKIEADFGKKMYHKGFFGCYANRDTFVQGVWKDKYDCKWQDLPLEIQDDYAKERALDHAKIINYQDSFPENVLLLQELARFCQEHKVKLLLVVPPFTRQYRKYANPEFADYFAKALSQIDSPYKLLNLYSHPLFLPQDFKDMDHLNDQGAKKMTELIMQELAKLGYATSSNYC